MRILIIEDDPIIGETLKDLLSSLYTVYIAATASKGLKLAKQGRHHLIILDLGLPDGNGKEVCKKIRAEGIKVPILVLTGNDALEDKVTALDFGADDYMVKPFQLDELCARLRALLRRAPRPKHSSIICYDDIVLDSDRRVVTIRNQTILLRRKEFDLLEYLLLNQNRVLTRAMIINQVWDDTTSLYSNTVDVHIKQLRDQIEKPFDLQLIKTVHGSGYTIGTNS